MFYPYPSIFFSLFMGLVFFYDRMLTEGHISLVFERSRHSYAVKKIDSSFFMVF